MQALRAQTVEQAAALQDARAEIESVRVASSHDLDDVRAVWQATVGSEAEDAPSMKDLAQALSTAKAEAEALRAERDAAVAARSATVGEMVAAQQEVTTCVVCWCHARERERERKRVPPRVREG